MLGLLGKLGLPNIADILPHILQVNTDPVQAANTTGGVVGAIPASKKELYVCVHGGYYIKVAASISELLGVCTIMHYILHIRPIAAQRVYSVLCRQFGDNSKDIKLTKMQKELVDKFKKP